MSQFFTGDTPRFQAEFRNYSSALADPTTVTLRIKTPGGVTTSYTYGAAQITKASTGIFYKDIKLNEAGTYIYSWEGTGTVEKYEEDTVFVKARGF